MKAAYFTAIRQIEVRDEPAPALSRPDEVLLRIDRMGVCGSDVHYYTDGQIGDDCVPLPASLGHECAGTVVEVGREVGGLSPGDRVAVDPAIACDTCDQCLQGRVNTCRDMNFMGCPGQGPGAAREYYVLPAKNCIPVPASMSLDQAALVEPLAVGLYSLRMAELRAGANIGILGSGPIGLGVLLAAKATGDCTSFVTDLLDPRLSVAQNCGADWTKKAIKDDTPAAEELENAIRGRVPEGLDVVFECSGDPNSIDQAQRLLVPGGTLIMIGIPPTVHVQFHAHLMRRMELTFKNVRRQDACMKPVVDLMSAGKINADPMLTHHFPLDRIQDAFELVADYGDGVVKAMVDVG